MKCKIVFGMLVIAQMAFSSASWAEGLNTAGEVELGVTGGIALGLTTTYAPSTAWHDCADRNSVATLLEEAHKGRGQKLKAVAVAYGKSPRQVADAVVKL